MMRLIEHVVMWGASLMSCGMADDIKTGMWSSGGLVGSGMIIMM